ncbi:MAG: hypothetical protein U5L06_11205 [Rhodovibrio sp.]|nr:hypothetical protein [Rhodovibrio sp.]
MAQPSWAIYSTENLKRKRIKEESRRLASAFLGEIIAIRRIVEIRDYQETIKKCAYNAEKYGNVAVPKIDVRQNYLIVYENNTDRLGLLPSKIIVRLSILYTAIKSVLEDFATFSENDYDNEDPEQLAIQLRELEQIVFGVLALSNVMIHELSEHAGEEIPEAFRADALEDDESDVEVQ